MVGPPQQQQATSTALEILTHHRRRTVLRCLEERETPISLADLADEVAAREHETVLAEIPPEAVERIHLSLYHIHVPKLAAADRVRYNWERGTVSLPEGTHGDDRFEQLRAALEPDGHAAE